MAIDQNIGDKILVSYVGEMFGQRLLSTFWYQVNTLVGAPNTTTFANALHTFLNAAGGMREKFLACCPPQYNLVATWVQTIEPTRVVKSIYLEAQVGTYAQDANTANLAGVISRRGGLANRKNQSSLHVPMANLDPDMSGGTLSAGQLAALEDLSAVVILQAPLSGVGTAFPIIRNGTGIGDVSPILFAAPQDSVRVMRRRTLRVGI